MLSISSGFRSFTRLGFDPPVPKELELLLPVMRTPSIT
jgi:hypothetical protein